MDLALFIGKMYPQEMKKIIKQMKTKQPEWAIDFSSFT